jgi:pimeloyl-ACP methyl ester carboxylesterase
MQLRLVLTILLFVSFVCSTSTLAQERLPRFEPGACTFSTGDWTRDVRLECGALVVAQDRARPERKSFRLAVAILHPKQRSSAPPLVIVHGGPSGPGGLRSGSMVLAVRWSAKLNRDIIVYDQRGAGLSEPALCPDIVERTIRVRNEISEVERERAYADSIKQCVAVLKRQGIDPMSFSSVTNADDLIDLRTALGYQRWDVYGVSYGARLAQEMMRRDPKGVRSVILASPLMPGLVKAEDPLTLQRGLERIFAACAAGPACHSAFPAPEEDLYALHAEFSAKPLEVTVQRDGSSATVYVDGRRLLSEILGRYSTGEMDRLPLLLHELRRGNRAAASLALVGNGRGNNPPNNVLTNLVVCNDSAASPEYRTASDAVKAELKPPFHPFLNDGSDCARWLERVGGARNLELVRSDIPALILTNQFDDRTPTEHGRRIAAALKRSYLFELPGLAHGVMPPGCSDSIVFSFLTDPTRLPDASCIAAMPRLAFSIDRLEQPRLFFTITAAGDLANPFVGEWEAAFPNAPRVFNFNLAIAGRVVSGAITAGGGAVKVPVIEGTADWHTLMFRVKTPDGERTVTFTGSLDGDRISFTRDILVPPGSSNPGGAALWGAAGARTFVATRAR